MKKSVIEKVESMQGIINPYYNLSYGEAVELCSKSGGPFELCFNSFCYGYMQGIKAAKAEMKQKQKTKIA